MMEIAVTDASEIVVTDNLGQLKVVIKSIVLC